MAQIAIYKQANNAIVQLYRVTAGKTLQLNGFTFSYYLAAAGLTSGNLWVTDNVLAVDYYLHIGQYTVVGSDQFSMSFPKPLIIDPQCALRVNSNNANLHSFAFIHGFEI